MTGTYEVRIITVTIDRVPDDVYAFAAATENLPRWASGLGAAGERDGDAWVSQTELGAVRVQMVPRNDFGVLDHHVTLPNGQVFYNPLRVVANGTGSEVSFTLFRLPGVSDEALAADAATIEQDLKTLKSLLEA